MNWLFRQVWVWILIAFVLGLILTWIYVVHKASRTVETADDRVHGADAKAGAAGSSKTADDVDKAPTEPAEPAEDEPFDQEAPVGGAPTAANDPAGPTSDRTTASTSRDDQPEAAGAAAAAKARAQAEEQRDTAPAEEQRDTAPAEAPKEAPVEAPDAAVDDNAEQSGDGDLTEQATDGDAAVKAGAAGVGVAAATGIGVAAVHHQRAAETDTSEPAGGPQPTDEASNVSQVVGAPTAGEASPDQDHTDEDSMREKFGAGAASPRSDGSAPDGYTVKGNADSMLFHTKDSPRYAATRPQVWFKDEASATSAGFAHWDRTKRGTSGTTPAHAARQHPTGDATGSSGGVGADTAATTAVPADSGPVNKTPAEEAPTTEAAPTDEAPVKAATGEAPAVPQDASARVEESEPDPITEQFGSGAASPREDGSAPSLSYTIKGNADTMMFHTEDSPDFDDTEAEIWFRDEAAAKAAGFIHWDRTKR